MRKMRSNQAGLGQQGRWVGCVVLALVGLLAVGGCGGRNTENYAVLKQLQDAIKQADTAADDETVLEKSLTMLSFKPEGDMHVWALSQTILTARNLKKDDIIRQRLPELDQALGALIEEEPPSTAKKDSDLARAYQLAESALREVNAYAFHRWDYGKDSSPDIIAAFKSSGEAYRKYHNDTILLSDVLWRDAEFYRTTGENMKAVPLYEAAIVKDFEGKYQKKCQEKLAAIWTEESAKTPLPTDIKEPTPIPSPHKEWMEIAERRMKAGLPEEEKRAITFRFGEVRYAFGNRKEGYDTFLALATSGQDASALDAAMRYLNLVHTNDTLDALRLLRSQLAIDKTPYLWKQDPFRQKFFEIAKKQFEAEPPLKEDAYKILQDLAHTNQDQTSVDAAKTLLTFASTHEDKFAFRILRKDIQDDKYLWSQPTIQNVVITLKKQVEGTD